MLNYIDRCIDVYKRLTGIYLENIDTLEKKCEKLEEILIELLNEKASEYNLTAINSVYPAKYYHIKTRVKKPVSFYEKLIRKNIGPDLIEKYNLLSIENKVNFVRKGDIVNSIYLLDDLIGLRIVTELKKDCPNVYSLLKNSNEYFHKKNIEFFDLDDQPQKMKNGLAIYRIKGMFQEMYGFELQIKSKIDEAWGDLDHSLFYKDYSISRIKDTVQVTMNNVGDLLDRIENLLYDLRESGANYKENLENLKFQEELEQYISPLLKEKFDVPYRLKEISQYLKFFKAFHNNINRPLELIKFDHLEWQGLSPLIQSYIEIRNKNFDLLIIEALYLSWKESSQAISITYDKYESELYEFIRLFATFISNEIKQDVKGVHISLLELLPYSPSHDIFLSTIKHKNLVDIYFRLDDLSLEEDIIKNNIVLLKRFFGVHTFSGNLQSLIDQEMIDGLDNAFLKIKENVELQKNLTDKVIYTTVMNILDKLSN